MVTGDDYQEYTITLGTLANAFIVLYGTQYDTTKMIDPGATIGLAFNHTISGGQSITLKSNESFAIKIFPADLLYELDFIKKNGIAIQRG